MLSFPRYRIELCVIVAVLVFSLWALLEANTMTGSASNFPSMMALSAACFSLLSLVRVWKVRGKDAEEVSLSFSSLLRILGFVGATVLFVISLNPLGFELAGSMLLLIGMALLDWRVALRYWWIAVLLPMFLGVVFRLGLQLRLPSSWPIF
ncbi:tripartite tricarboxylate transporter TctB family protein [Franzmannia pantelleriensis]|uniref:tripartite tricarboxylate transporter TctB family protein n=1 Tax=Franzmannia pantelleriensis TaxID=48727 RepID=UPI0015A428E5|nr:tripartite tricarboxylate transporter TctB family protein [Halomonas pantelleriensis]